jgi:hypothetical protein
MESEDLLQRMSQEIGAELERLAGSGWEYPIYVVVVAANGTIMAFHYDDSPTGRLVAEVLVPPGVAVPLNVIFVSTRGEAYRKLIDEESLGAALPPVN